jgi:hypothetical protein
MILILALTTAVTMISAMERWTRMLRLSARSTHSVRESARYCGQDEPAKINNSHSSNVYGISGAGEFGNSYYQPTILGWLRFAEFPAKTDKWQPAI